MNSERRVFVTGDIGEKHVDAVIELEVVVEVARQRLAWQIRGSDLDARRAKESLRNERFLHAPRDEQVAPDLLIELAELIRIPLRAKESAEPRQEDLQVGALRDVVIRPDAQTLDEGVRRVCAREHEDGNRMELRIGLDPAGDLEAVHARHSIVDHEGIGRDAISRGQPFFAGRRRGDVVVALEKPAGDAQVVGVVIDDDDALAVGHGSIVATDPERSEGSPANLRGGSFASLRIRIRGE